MEELKSSESEPRTRTRTRTRKACCVPSCENYTKIYDQDLWVSFPTVRGRQIQWLNLLKLEEEYGHVYPSTLTREYKICTAHFESKYLIKKKGKTSVTSNAVPLSLQLTTTTTNNFLKQESIDQEEKEFKFVDATYPIATTFNDDPLQLDELNNTSAPSSLVCILCHLNFSFTTTQSIDDDAEDESRRVKSRQNLAHFAKVQFKCIKSIRQLLTDDFEFCVCDACTTKIDTLLDLHVQLRNIQKSFYSLRAELIQEWCTSQEQQQQQQRSSYPEDLKPEPKKEPNQAQNLNIDQFISMQKEKAKLHHRLLQSKHRRPRPLKTLTTTCQYCQKSFALRAQLTKHLVRAHARGSKTLACQYCSRSRKITIFYDASGLEKHTKTCKAKRKANKNSTPKEGWNDSKQCPICHKTFTRALTFRSHQRTHAPRRFKCPSCPATFHSSSMIQVHSVVHSRARDYVCEECGKSYSRRDKLKIHLDTVHGKLKTNLICAKCPCRRFLSLGELRKHAEICTGVDKASIPTKVERFTPTPKKKTPGVCEFCGKICSSYTNLVIHLEGVHKMGSKLKSPRKSSSSSRKSLRKKSINNKQLLPCNICTQVFNGSAALARHNTKHTGILLFKCDYCQEGFNYKLRLRQHLVRVHPQQHLTTTGKSHVCGMCWVNFELVSQLQEHQASVHVKCGDCGKLIRDSASLKVHSVIHTGEKPYQCKYCGKAFNHVANLREHESIHTGEKRWRCDGCGDRFVRRKFLEAHVQKTHPNLL